MTFISKLFICGCLMWGVMFSSHVYARHVSIQNNMLITLPALYLGMIKTGMTSVQTRIGDLQQNNDEQLNGLWIRNYAKHLKIKHHFDTNLNLYGLEAGYDIRLYKDDAHAFYVGIMGGYMYADNIRTKQPPAYKQEGNAYTPSAGIYGAWFNHKGWFLDATVRYFWPDLKIQSTSGASPLLSFNPKQTFFTSSAQTGRTFTFVIGPKTAYLIQPKIELYFAQANGKHYPTPTAMTVYYGKTQSLLSRAAFLLSYRYTNEKTVYAPFVEFGLTREWLGRTTLEYAGKRYKSDINDTGFDFTLGIKTNMNTYGNFYAKLMFEQATVYNSVAGHIGVRVNF